VTGVQTCALPISLVIPGKKCWRHNYCDRAKFCEYLMAGKNIIAADFPPAREILGRSAIYYKPENINELAEKMVMSLKTRKPEGDKTKYIYQKNEKRLIEWLDKEVVGNDN